MKNNININPMSWKVQPHWYEIKLENECVDYLMNIVNDAEEKAAIKDVRKTKSNLVGNISKSFNILEEENKSKYFSKKYLNLCIKRWLCDHGGHHPIPMSVQETLLKNGKLNKAVISAFWANYQYKYEFNPLHNHSGIYSFVIWLKIPYNYNEEILDNRFSGIKIYDRKAGAFEFYQPKENQEGKNYEIHKYELNPKYEGTMLFFPSGLTHQVFPFYSSDEKRISLSGNVSFDIFLNDEE